MYVFKVWPADHGLKSIPRFDLRSRGPVVDRVIKKRPLRDLERIMIPNSFRDHSLWLIWLVRPRSRSTGKWSQSQSASEKNKTSRSSLPRPRDSPSPVFSPHHIPHSFVSSSFSSFLPFFSSLLPPHDNESLPCGKGIICGTGSKMPCEPHYRMHDYHDSGAALVSTSFLPDPRGLRQVERPPSPPRIFPPLSCRYRRRIAETVNQRQGRVRGRGIGAACCSSLLYVASTTRQLTENAVASPRYRCCSLSQC